MERLSIEKLIEDIVVEFEDSNESDYIFFQRLIDYVIKRLMNLTVVCNDVVFYGSYQVKITSRTIKFHFTGGKFTHLTSDRRHISQTFNKMSFR